MVLVLVHRLQVLRSVSTATSPLQLARYQCREALYRQFTQGPGKPRRVAFLSVGLASEREELLDV